MNRLKISIAVSTALLVSPCAFSVESAGGISGEGSFYNAREEGWFWYQQEPEPEEPEEIQVQPPVVVASQPEQPKEEPKKEEPKKEEEKPVVIAESSGDDKPSIPVGSVEWIKVNLENYKRMALDNPTVENLRAYMYMQRLAMDRAEEFAHAGQLAVHGDPFLDETTKGPIGGGMAVRNRFYAQDRNKELLKDIFAKVGIFFVFKNKCEMCNEQANLLQIAQRIYNVKVKAVSIDQPDPDSKIAQMFPDYKVIPEVMSKLNIYAVPSTFAIDEKTASITPIVQGVLTLDDLTSRFLEKASEKHWLPQKQLAQIRPEMDETSLSTIFQPGQELANKLEQISVDNPYSDSKSDLNQNFIAPDKLVEMIQKAKSDSLPEDFIPRG